MDDIVNKYFNDQTTLEDYVEVNTFYPPADLDKIREIEKLLGIEFPQDYISFLLTTNGYNGKLGQSYSIFIQIEQIIPYTKSYGGEFFPWIVFIGTDGGTDMYVIDKRSESPKFGILPYISTEDDFISLGNNFEEFVKHLYQNDY